MAIPAMINNSPVNGSISWAAFTIQYNGVGYGIAAGSTAARWVWWRYNGGASVIEAGADIPTTLTDDDLVLFGNKLGIAVRVQASTLVDGELLVDGSIFADALAANQISAQHIVTTGLDAAVIKFGTMSGQRIAADTITALEIKGNTITANEIATDTITANEIATDAITANEIAADSVTASEIAGKTITANEIAAGAVTSNELFAKAVTADKLSSLLGILGTLLIGDGSGRVISMDPTNGINVVDNNGDAVFQVPTSLLSQINMTADVVARSLTALGVIAMRNPINELSPGAGFYIRKGNTPPRTPATVTMTNTKRADASKTAPSLYWDAGAAGGSYWAGKYVTLLMSDAPGGSGLSTGGDSYADIWRIDHAAGTAATFVKRCPTLVAATDIYSGIKRVATTTQAAGYVAWVVPYIRTTGVPTQRLLGLDESFNKLWDVSISTWITDASIANFSRIPMFTASELAGQGMCAQAVGSTGAGKLQFWYVNLQNGGMTPAGATTTAFNNNTLLRSMLGTKSDNPGGANDFRFIVCHSDGFVTFDSTSSRTYIPAEDFPVPQGSSAMTNLIYDDSRGRFYSTDDTFNWFTHSTDMWIDPNYSTKRVSFAWEDNTGGQTTEGQVQQYTAGKRQYTKITVPPIPSGATKYRLFFGRGPTDGGRTTHFSNGAFTTATQTIEKPVFTGTVPVLVSTIPDSSPAFMQTDANMPDGTPIVRIDGSGPGNIGQMSWDSTGKVSLPGLTSQDRAKVWMTADTSIPNATWTNLALTTTDFDTNTMVSTVSGITRITIKKSGYYRVQAKQRWAVNATGFRGISIKKSSAAGVFIPDVDVEYTPGFAGQEATIIALGTVHLNAGEYLSLQAYQNSGAALMLQGAASNYVFLDVSATDLD